MVMRSMIAKVVAALLVVALQLAFTPLSASPGSASLSGQVVVAQSRAPLAGVRLHVADSKTQKIVSSVPTSADGKFTVSDLPPSSYQLAVESDGKLFVADAPVRLAAGASRTVEVAVDPNATGRLAKDASKGGYGSGMSAWNNPLTATLIVIGAAVVIGFAVDRATEDDEEPSSPSAP